MGMLLRRNSNRVATTLATLGYEDKTDVSVVVEETKVEETVAEEKPKKVTRKKKVTE